jgi:hypothetical protein
LAIQPRKNAPASFMSTVGEWSEPSCPAATFTVLATAPVREIRLKKMPPSAASSTAYATTASPFTSMVTEIWAGWSTGPECA